MDLSGQNLENAWFYLSTLTNADFTEANLTRAVLDYTNLESSIFAGANLTNSHLSSSTLPRADLTGANLMNADANFAVLESANLTNAELSGAAIDGVNLRGAIGLTLDQLYSTSSYERKSLREIQLDGHDLSHGDFGGHNLAHAGFRDSLLNDANFTEAILRNADFSASTLSGANLQGADLKNANFGSTTLSSATFDSATVYNQWTVFPADFDPVANGLTLVPTAVGDFDANGIVGSADNRYVSDVDLLSSRIYGGTLHPSWLTADAMFDLNGDQVVDREDHTFWVKDLFGTAFGDAGLDGVFSADDLVAVFASGKFRTGETATWQHGDWNADGLFTSADLILAFQDDGYQRPGARNAVPEPTSMAALLAGLIGLAIVSNSRRKCV